MGAVRVVLEIPRRIAAAQVRRRVETVKPTATQSIPRVCCFYAQIFHTFPDFNILGAAVFRTRGILPAAEPAQGFAAEHVAPSSAVVALPHVRFEAVAEIYRVRRVFRRQKISQILDNDEGVVIDLHEPIAVVIVVLVDVVECRHRLGGQVTPALAYADVDRRKVGV